MSTNIHVNDIGTIFKVRIVNDLTGSPLDISGASTKQIIIKKHQGVAVARDATFTVDGSDGWMQYSAVSGDLDINGEYSIQGKVVGGGYTNFSEVGTFTVLPNI